MGRSANCTCRTCKKTYSLGYCSYSSWMDHKVNTLAEFDASEDPNKEKEWNQNYRRFLVEHGDHDWFGWSEDFAGMKGKDLVSESAYHGPDLLAKDFDKYEHIVW